MIPSAWVLLLLLLLTVGIQVRGRWRSVLYMYIPTSLRGARAGSSNWKELLQPHYVPWGSGTCHGPNSTWARWD